MNTNLDLPTLWKQLAAVRSLRFTAQSFDSGSGWNGTGTGTVKVEISPPETMLFHESGLWSQQSGKSLPFTNIYRWCAYPDENRLRLEHLRFGRSNPVFLFDLQQKSDNQWESVEPHVCSEDLYSATLSLENDLLSLDWTVKGKTKNERIAYVYAK
ncbi:DUF6314 family protein [Gimesia fumaroli]|uniref:DUF6314 domain-containing protein n=1 Tax=Gimesia fumaroli TaxID=2527976 RepID=A0A518I4T8_9PLAN|nr:DUF6314 family protein [Gimesia fumaroli]QDV48073.1 hypothetical protein Enr17x_00820 [Gimesia fumaroli]